MDKWTVEMIEHRLVEAAVVMRRLPSVRVPGYFNTWPKMVFEFADRVGQQPEPMRLPASITSFSATPKAMRRAELVSRKSREGFEGWGNEHGKFD